MTEGEYCAALAEPLKTVESTYGLLAKAAQAALDSPAPQDIRARNVAMKLLARLGQDLACTIPLVATGYPVQALSIAASVFEVSFTVAYIRDEHARAQEWIDHDDPTRPFKRVLDLLQDVIAANSAKHYSTYRQLCMAKHANPLLEQSFGIQEQDGEILVRGGPVFDEVAFRMAWYALTNGAGLASIAIASVLTHHVDAEQVPALSSSLNSLSTRITGHTREALARGWDTDPYPGRWRLPT